MENKENISESRVSRITLMKTRYYKYIWNDATSYKIDEQGWWFRRMDGQWSLINHKTRQPTDKQIIEITEEEMFERLFMLRPKDYGY